MIQKEALRHLQGMHDVLPEDFIYVHHLEDIVKAQALHSGFKRIETPVLEYTELYLRGVGASTDIVEKEMYAFVDKGDNHIAVKPEGTAGVVRAYIEHNMKELPQPVLLYYLGPPNLRHDRPQRGRYRQHTQYGFEALGSDDAFVDAQILSIGYNVIKNLGIQGCELHINSIGCKKCRGEYMEMLKNYYSGKERNLCEDCQRRITTNPLRLLDCKEEDCAILANLAPKLCDNLCEDCQKHDTNVKEYLGLLEIPFVLNPKLVRGLDYYNRTVAEYMVPKKQGTISLGGGGRYDYLAEMLGGDKTPAVGIGLGRERVILEMKDQGIVIEDQEKADIFLIQLGEEAKKQAISLLKELQGKGLSTVGALGSGSIKSQLRLADRYNVKYALILGEVEVRDKVVIIRDMEKGVQETVSENEIVTVLKKRLG